MSSLGRQAHWENVYATKAEHTVSWFQESPDISLDLVRATEVGMSASIIDVGGGASRLIDALVDKGFKALTVLDLSEKALAASKARLGARSTHVQWVVADITTWEPSQTYDVWHDRAALHFLTDPKDRAAYAQTISKAVRTGGHVIIGTFAPDGPERCSGLPIVRHDATTLGQLLGHSFVLIETRRHDHQTPAGATQRFQFSRFQRTQ
jgi:SAM-dependent methyltransferase